MDTQEKQEPEYVPTEEERERWAAYRGAVERGLFNEEPDDDNADAGKESA